MEFFEAMGAGNNALAGLAQLVEHLICNQGVTSSNLVAGTISRWQFGNAELVQ